MTDLDKEVERANDALRIMQNELVKEAFETMDKEIYRQFKAVAPTDSEALMQVRTMQYMREKFEQFFVGVMQNGKVAQMEIDRKKKSLRQRFLG